MAQVEVNEHGKSSITFKSRLSNEIETKNKTEISNRLSAHITKLRKAFENKNSKNATKVNNAVGILIYATYQRMMNEEEVAWKVERRNQE